MNENSELAQMLRQTVLLPGNPAGTGVTDPYSFDASELTQYEIESELQNRAVQAGMFDPGVLDVPGGVLIQEQVVDVVEAPPRVKQPLRVDNIAGTLATTSVPVNVPSDCKLMRFLSGNSPFIVTASPSTFADQSIDLAQQTISMARGAVFSPVYYVVRSQLDQIHVAGYSGGQLQITFFCGDINPTDFLRY